MIVSALPTILNYLRSKYHNFQLSTFNFQLLIRVTNRNLDKKRGVNAHLRIGPITVIIAKHPDGVNEVLWIIPDFCVLHKKYLCNLDNFPY